jgi:hypothetical protein
VVHPPCTHETPIRCACCAKATIRRDIDDLNRRDGHAAPANPGSARQHVVLARTCGLNVGRRASNDRAEDCALRLEIQGRQAGAHRGGHSRLPGSFSSKLRRRLPRGRSEDPPRRRCKVLGASAEAGGDLADGKTFVGNSSSNVISTGHCERRIPQRRSAVAIPPCRSGQCRQSWGSSECRKASVCRNPSVLIRAMPTSSDRLVGCGVALRSRNPSVLIRAMPTASEGFCEENCSDLCESQSLRADQGNADH